MTANVEPIQISIDNVMLFNAYFNWRQVGCGFGQLSLGIHQKDGHTVIIGSPEGKNKEWMRQALHALVDTVMDAVPQDADRYNLQVKLPHPPGNDEEFIDLE
jgi:hypothetical protein